jgi:aminoglycoside phosphotransferase family enzyme
MQNLPETARALMNPQAYPDKPEKIELIQTQMSFVFLTGDYVYKMKKPVNLGYLDYTTLEQRHYFCNKELELNQRLCPEAYLEMVPVTRQEDCISVKGNGEIIDYAVKMRYLPQEAMMDVLLGKNQVTEDMICRVAQKVADFHRQAATSAEIGTFGSLEAIEINTDENFDQTEKYISNTISRETFDCIKNYTSTFIEKNTDLFRRRVTEGKIKDCHGDLHAAHICFCDNICIFDCIEFNDRFRYSDVASEVAFLAMDLDHYGHTDLSRVFIEAYVEASGDQEIKELLAFYKCYRAYVRGKVGCFKLDDPYVPSQEKETLLKDTRGYFELAESYIMVQGGKTR